MDISEALAFIARHDRTVLSTRRVDGYPQMSPVNSAVLNGRIHVSSRSHLAKVRNLRRDPRVSVLVFTEAFYGKWVQVDGTAEIVEQPEAMQVLIDTYRAIRGEHPDWDDYRAAMIRDHRVAIRITPLRATRGGG